MAYHITYKLQCLEQFTNKILKWSLHQRFQGWNEVIP